MSLHKSLKIKDRHVRKRNVLSREERLEKLQEGHATGGITNMADRLGAVGGTLEIRSTPGGGTEISGRVPVGGAHTLTTPARVG